MTLSVIIPVYNVEKYIEKCLHSLLNQTMPINQIIIVNDGSIDNSIEICKRYAALYDSIIIINKQNQGLGMARNSGLEAVTSDFVSFFDPDDYADYDYIEKLCEPILFKEADTSKSSYRRIDRLGKSKKDETIISGFYTGDEVKNLFLPRIIGSDPDIKDSVPTSVCSTIFSMKIINDHAIRFKSEREWISEDLLFNIEYYSYAQKVEVLSYIGYNYCYNQGSLTTKYLSERFEKCKTLYFAEERILQENNLLDKTRYRLSRQFFNYLRMCFSQLNKKISELSIREGISSIQKICSDQLVVRLVSSYPVMSLGIKQRFFLYLIKNKRSKLIYLLFAVFGIK